MRFRLSSPILLSATLTAAACGSGQEADPASVQERLRAIVPGLVDPTLAATDFAAESTALAGLSDSLAAFDQLGLPFSLAGEGGGPISFDGELEPTGEEMAEELAGTIFTEENYEGDGVYRLPPELFCEPDETGATDPECLDTFAQLELRLRAELVDDGLDLTLLVGPERDAPLAVELRPARAALVVDLAGAAGAIAHVAAVIGEEIELPEVLEGQIALALDVMGPQHVTLALEVREAIRVELDTADGRLAVSTEARTPLAALGLDGDDREIQLQVDVGRTVLSMPHAMMDPDSRASGTFALDWKGLSFTALARDGSEQVAISSIGLGDSTSTISLDDTTLVAVDLNPDDGRRAALTLAPAPDGGLPIATFDPGLDLTIDVFLQPLADAGDAVEAWLLDDTYRLAIAGDQPATQAIAGDDLAGTPGALRVTRGSLTVAADSDAVVVEAGSCLIADPVEPGEHPIIGAVAAGACP
ncbi:MAG TPA: hypothetical protein VKZ63_22630 [Kofleriaceae bacterium]|nr:hypothetical protein [Kofleriaceae bacterium]